jgi:hypothetical protein
LVRAWKRCPYIVVYSFEKGCKIIYSQFPRRYWISTQ